MSPRLSAYLVAEIGFNHLSRAFRIFNLQPNFDEEEIREMVCSHSTLEYFRVEPEQRLVDVSFLDIWQAAKVSGIHAFLILIFSSFHRHVVHFLSTLVSRALGSYLC